MANNPKNFRFPRSFTLFGHKYRVEFVSDLYHKEDAYGYFDDDTKVLRIQLAGPLTKTVEIRTEEFESVEFIVTDEMMVETFFHELTHAILYAMDQDELSENEKFVGMFGKALLEIYLYSEYEETPKSESKKTDSTGTSVE